MKIFQLEIFQYFIVEITISIKIIIFEINNLNYVSVAIKTNKKIN